MKYMLLAGEASGDLHASHLITSLRQKDADASFVFLGGDKMTEASGEQPLVHINEMAFMGFSEVLRNLGAIRRNLKVARKALSEFRPDALILVDYPSFNLKVARTAKKLGIPVFYYISPKVWAWKEHRVKSIKRLVDKMLVIFPFEVDYYKNRHNYEVEFVGNPSVAEVDAALADMPDRTAFLERNKLRDRPIIALLPGSRKGEIKNNLGVMTEVTDRFPQYRAVIAGAPGISPEFYSQFTKLPVIYDQTLTLLAHSRAALVTSGTATLEAALVGTPQIACYRSNGRKIAYNIMKHFIKVPYVTLPNLIANRQVIDEMLVHLCTVEAVFQRLVPLLRDTEQRSKMLEGYDRVRSTLSAPGLAQDKAAEAIIKFLS